MDLKSLPILAAIQQKMEFLNRRQTMLSQNIANANTPGYKPQDLKAPNFEGLLSQYKNTGVKLTVTQAGHMRGAGAAVATSAGGGGAGGGGSSAAAGHTSSKDMAKVKPSEVAPNGNGVTLENEMVKMTQSQIEYNMLLNVYKKHTGMLYTALGKGR